MEIREYSTYQEDEILNLYSSVGWTAYTDMPEFLREGFRHSLLVLAAYEEDELLGILRAVGDGYTIVWIQDILVFPQQQRKGVGTRLIASVLERYRHVRQIGLATDDTPKTTAFYRALGFTEMSEMGCRAFFRV
ncbi:MAG: GNAT family N-acetyltransferase [Lachnospiraceae bacterium]|nr:GNAT family N-acetyltransferase [Lachnospiraceae bacterium]